MKPGFSYSVDPAKQIEALNNANPTLDAQESFNYGDYRFVGDRFVLTRILGIVYDSRVDSALKQYGFKVVARNDYLVTNEVFIKLRVSYEEKYNQTLYHLLK